MSGYGDDVGARKPRRGGSALGGGAGALALAALLWTCASTANRPRTPAEPPKSDVFAGSATCQACHPAVYDEWRASMHHRTLRAPTEADLEMLRSTLFCVDLKPDLVLGGKHHLRYLQHEAAEDGSESTHVLPCSWNVGARAWEVLHLEDWRSLAFESRCEACHVTALRTPGFTFVERGVGCEACHGPASRHGGFADAGDMLAFGSSPRSAGAAAETMVCASCHLQGGESKTTGYPFAANYTAGDPLFEDLTFDWSEVEGAATNPVDVHQKLLIKQVQIDGRADMSCTSCHGFHAMTHEKHATLPRSDYCLTCHLPDTFAVRPYRQGCNVCEF